MRPICMGSPWFEDEGGEETAALSQVESGKTGGEEETMDCSLVEGKGIWIICLPALSLRW